ncbi:MAG: class I SAM-dependent methyltransferase [Pseudomonadota bacterium]|nr:class I SAM-dependent methyltransferase [Pseudomonadota bacterium]
MTPFRLRQEEQLSRYTAWVVAQGGEELPVQLSTYLQANQQERIKRLREESVGTVLELGCSWGYVLASVTADNPQVQAKGSAGVDRVEWNVLLARILSPYENSGLTFIQTDVLTGLPFYDDQSFDTVLVPEILEHLSWPNEVQQVLDTAKRLARRRVIITVPNGEHDTHEATSPKHQWLPTQEHSLQMLQWLYRSKGDEREFTKALHTPDFFIWAQAYLPEGLFKDRT